MIFDNLGQPSCNGCEDKRDSAVLNSLLICFDLPGAGPLENYSTGNGFVRCRGDIESDMSRDNSVPLICAILKRRHYPIKAAQHIGSILNRYRFQNGDLCISPSVRGVLRLAIGLPMRWYHKLWLNIDILWASFIKPLDESNQLLCMLAVVDPKYLKRYCRWNKKWQSAIFAYWQQSWRKESEFSLLLVSRIFDRIK